MRGNSRVKAVLILMSASDEFKSGDEIFCSYLDEKNIQRDVWVFVVEVGLTASIVKTKSGAVLFIPSQRILKLKKKGEY